MDRLRFKTVIWNFPPLFAKRTSCILSTGMCLNVSIALILLLINVSASVIIIIFLVFEEPVKEIVDYTSSCRALWIFVFLAYHVRSQIMFEIIIIIIIIVYLSQCHKKNNNKSEILSMSNKQKNMNCIWIKVNKKHCERSNQELVTHRNVFA